MWILFIFTLLFIILALCLITGTFITIRTQKSPNQNLFLSGKLPQNLPSGVYNGKENEALMAKVLGLFKMASFLGWFIRGLLTHNFRKARNKFDMSWQGKKFDSSQKTGINIFKKNGRDIEKYPFKFYKALGLTDELDVLRIDYDTNQNPFFVRLIKDEIVEIKPGHFLGKINFNVVPGLSIPLGYFELEK